jgi:VRR-NUC domain
MPPAISRSAANWQPATMSERDVQNAIRLALGQDCVLFRNNTGQAWAGRTQRMGKDVILYDARPFHGGLCVGSSDLIGWKTVQVTPDMVGKPLAVFCAIEVKSLTGRATEEQRNFIGQVQRAGGLAGIAKTVGEAQAILGLRQNLTRGKPLYRRTGNVDGSGNQG